MTNKDYKDFILKIISEIEDMNHISKDDLEALKYRLYNIIPTNIDNYEQLSEAIQILFYKYSDPCHKPISLFNKQFKKDINSVLLDSTKLKINKLNMPKPPINQPITINNIQGNGNNIAGKNVNINKKEENILIKYLKKFIKFLFK